MNFNRPEDSINEEYRTGSVLKKKVVEKAEKKLKNNENRHIDPDNVFNGFKKNKKLYKSTKLKKKIEEKQNIDMKMSY